MNTKLRLSRQAGMSLICSLLMLSLFLSLRATLAVAADCQFVLGFKALHDLIPDKVGDCLVNEHHNPDNGDGLQESSGPADGKGTGLLAWRKADNWTAYTDGYHTWVNGPCGLQQRLNVERFGWEATPTLDCARGSGLNIVASPTPDTRGCSQWPAEILNLQGKLAVPDGLCLISYLDNPTSPEALACCGSFTGIYIPALRQIRIRAGSPVGGILNAMAHERTHAHQHWAILNAGLGEPGDLNGLWLRTPEGIDFVIAVNQILEDHATKNIPLPSADFGQGQLTELEANVSGDWYANPSYVSAQWHNWPALQQFAQKWLPKG